MDIIKSILAGGILVVLISIGIIYYFFNRVVSGVKSTIQTKDTSFILKDIDFSNGSYGLYIRHKEQGTFFVDDETALKDNLDVIKVKRSWMNFLPAEADREYGIRLFKDNREILGKQGAVFSAFEIGDIAHYGKPVEAYSFKGNRAEMLGKLKLLSEEERVYIFNEPKIREENRAYTFRLELPTITVSVKREDGYVEGWKKLLKQRVYQLTEPLTDFDISFSCFENSNMAILDYSTPKKDIQPALYNVDGKTILCMDEYVFLQILIHFSSTKEVAEQLQEIDFSSLVSDRQRNHLQLMQGVQEKISRSNKPELNKEKVGFYSYTNQLIVGELSEYTYRVEWFEVDEEAK